MKRLGCRHVLASAMPCRGAEVRLLDAMWGPGLGSAHRAWRPGQACTACVHPGGHFLVRGLRSKPGVSEVFLSED